MDQAKIEEKVIQTLEGVLTKKTQGISLEDRLIEDLGLDSFGSLELMFELEDAVGVKISEEQAKKFITVQDVVNYLVRQGQVGGPLK